MHVDRGFLMRGSARRRTGATSPAEPPAPVVPNARNGEPVAVVGWACRLPGAEDPAAFWRLLVEAEDAVSEMPGTRNVPVPSGGRESPGMSPQVPVGGFLENIDGFDAEFFGISPAEAAWIDPQQRLLLELAWECAEDARIAPGSLRDTATAVFVGAMADDFAKLAARCDATAATRHTLAGTQRGLLANRVSRTLGLRGPSLSVDTGQSSSLVAVHLACESLRRRESRAAFAAGVHLVLDPDGTGVVEKFGALSPNRRCRTFDAAADGYVRGEGGVVLMLKLLSDALADGDPVHCVIRGSAVTNDGHGSDGTAVPSAAGQEAAVRAACAAAGAEPAEVQYVELHGTGTRVGDPVEAAALGAAYGGTRDPDSPLLVGSAKTNVGHLEGAAGIVGLLKAGLCIVHRRIPASLHFDTPNPRIPMDALRLRVVTAARPWPHEDRPLTAGVSSFGMGGTNAHAVLAEPPAAPRADETGTPPEHSAVPVPWVLSGRDAQDLARQAARLRAHLGDSPEASPADIAFSLATTRTRQRHRAVVLGTGADTRLAALDALADGRSHPGTVTGSPGGQGGTAAPVAFLMPGQGAQRLGAGRELHAAHRAFAEAFDEICAHLDGLLDRPLREVMWAAPGTAAADLLDRTDFTQPALFALSVALYRLFAHWGVEPDHLVGHSVGEIAAAHVAGVLSLPDACTLVAARGALMRELPQGGAMVAVEAAAEEVEPLLPGTAVSLAAVNGPRATVVSGDDEAVAEVAAHWRARGRRTRRLPVSHAFHSAHMEPMLDAFAAVAGTLTYHAPTRPTVSALTGRLADGIDTPRHWIRQVREPVRFHDGLLTLRGLGCTTYLELGPDAVLASLAREALTDLPGAAFAAALRRGRPEAETAAAALATLHVQGREPEWGTLLPGARRVALPSQVFLRKSHWPFQGTESGQPGAVPETSARAPQPSLAAPVPTGGTAPGTAAPPPVVPGDREPGPPGSGPQATAGDEPAALGRRRLTLLVRDSVADVLGYGQGETVPLDRAFKELGFDSLGAVEFRDRLGAALGVALPSTLTYDHPTPAAVVERLLAPLDADEAATASPALPPAFGALRPDAAHEPVAVVGVGCRFPGGVVSPEGLWGLVSGG
ncbi:type I polyketide synthase, partial [Streptomyces sp. NPDC001020]